MLSQRVAKFYLAQAWGASVPNAQAELDKARAEFVAAIDVLANASPRPPGTIKQEIDLARNQWVFFETALKQNGAGAAFERSTNVFLSSENILSVIDKVTGMYARLAT